MNYNQEQQQLINEYSKLTKFTFINEKSTLKTLYFLSPNKKLLPKTFKEIKKYIEFKKQNNQPNIKEIVKQIIKPKQNKESKPKQINISFWLEQEQAIKFKQFIKSNNLTINSFMKQLIKALVK